MNNVHLGIPDVVFIVFLILKLVGVITWSWWWIFSPYWISIPIYLLIKLSN